MNTRPATPPDGAIPDRFTYGDLWTHAAVEYIVRAQAHKVARDMGRPIERRDLIAEIKFRQIADLLRLIERSPALKAHIRDVAARDRPSIDEAIAEAFNSPQTEQGDADACDA